MPQVYVLSDPDHQCSHNADLRSPVLFRNFGPLVSLPKQSEGQLRAAYCGRNYERVLLDQCPMGFKKILLL